MEYKRYYWLNEESRTFLSRGYITETPEQRIKDIAIKAEKYLNIKGFAEKFEDYMARGFYSLSTPVWINFCFEQDLTSINISYTCNYTLVHKSIFDTFYLFFIFNGLWSIQ